MATRTNVLKLEVQLKNAQTVEELEKSLENINSEMTKFPKNSGTF
jgi:hypothetical protein